jgi:hypothetical protein
MLSSLFGSGESRRAWSISRAAAYGAVVGILAALFKTIGPLQASGASRAPAWEIAGAAVGFALLCAGAAALRNAIARRLVWPKM